MKAEEEGVDRIVDGKLDLAGTMSRHTLIDLVKEGVRGLEPGQILLVRTAGPEGEEEVRRFASEAGHEVVGYNRESLEGPVRIWIKRN